MENYIIANKTDVGRTRQVNEDSMITFDSPNGRVVAVCDGMGGQAAGDVASQLACNIIRDILENNTFANPLEAITRSMIAANQGILYRTAQQPELEGMGATCVMLIIKDNVVYYGWVGDSRIYYISNHTIRQISRDQSYVQSLVDSGQITAEEAAHHPQKNEITNALGLQGMTPPVLCQMPITPEPGGVFLLCSDGLTGMVDDAQIERTVSKPELSLQEKAEHLVALANRNGGLDNISVQLVEFPRNENGGAFANPQRRSGKKNDLWMLITAAVLVVALAVGGYFVFLNKKETKVVEQKKENIDNRTQKVTNKETAQPAEPVKAQPAEPVKAQPEPVKRGGSPKTKEQKPKSPKDDILNGNKQKDKSKVTEKIIGKSEKEKTSGKTQELLGKVKEEPVPNKDLSKEIEEKYKP